MVRLTRPKHILITGANRGLGAALARAYAAPGVVLGLLARNRDDLAEVIGACDEQGATCLAFEADITDADRIRDVIREFHRQHPVDLFIANAGVTSGLHDLNEQESWEGTRLVAGVNFCGALYSVHAALQVMLERGQGQIAIMGSLGATPHLPFSPAYSAAKTGVETYGLALRPWAMARGVAITVICPGFVDTRMSRRLRGAKPNLISADRAAALIRRRLVSAPARLAFPWHLDIGIKLLGLMPPYMRRWIVPLFAFTVERSDRPGIE